MRRIAALTALAVAACLAAVLASMAAGGPGGNRGLPGAEGTLWVANRTLHNVTAFDASTGEVLATIAVGREPNSLTIPRNRGKVYVSDEASNTVSIISTDGLAVVKTIPLGPRPHHIRSSWDGGRVYVPLYGSNRVAVIDTDTDTVIADWQTNTDPAVRTHMPFATRDDSLVLTANEIANEIAFVDGRTGARLGSVPIGNRPSEALVVKNGDTAYATVRNENRVKRIDVETRAVTGELVVGTMPDTMFVSPNGKTLYVALRGTPAQLSVVDLKSFTLEKTIDLAGPGTIAGHNWTSANGRYSFVAFEGATGSLPGIAVVDHHSDDVVATYPYPGGGRPHGLQLDKVGD